MRLSDAELSAQRPSDEYRHRCKECDRWWTHSNCIAQNIIQNACDVCIVGSYPTEGFALFEGPLSGIIDGYWE